MKLIVGLGNPGRAYANSRHNIGFRCLNLFARQNGIDMNGRRSKAKTGEGEIGEQRVILAKPRTFMNLSGESVAPLLRYYQIEYSDLLVVYDDLDFPLGKVRIRERGGSGGHNGMRSIIDHLGSQEFPRIRVGIGPEECDENENSTSKTRTPQYVLGHFTAKEKAIVDEVCQRVGEAILCILIDGIVPAMNKYNAM